MGLYTRKFISESAKRMNDKGEVIPKECPLCGYKVGLYFKGEPVWLCSNKECNKFFGVLPAPKK